MISCTTVATENNDLDRMIDLTFQQDASSNKTGNKLRTHVFFVTFPDYYMCIYCLYITHSRYLRQSQLIKKFAN